MLTYLIIVNILSLLLMKIDKTKAIKRKERIPEIVLITISFLGGSIGSIIGMYLFHHKTQKLKFQILIPVSLVLTIIIILNYLRVL